MSVNSVKAGKEDKHGVSMLRGLSEMDREAMHGV